MTVRLPQSLAGSPLAARLRDGHLRQLDDELAQEKASALGRLGRAVEVAVRQLSAFDAQTPEGGRHERSALVGAAYRALWEFIVQREACGLRDARGVMRDYRVPDEVARLLGVAPEPRPKRPVTQR